MKDSKLTFLDLFLAQAMLDPRSQHISHDAIDGRAQVYDSIGILSMMVCVHFHLAAEINHEILVNVAFSTVGGRKRWHFVLLLC